MIKSTVGMLGLGEVGTALSSIIEKYFTVLQKDLKSDSLLDNKIDILHVCIPYSKNFEKIVLKQVFLNQPKLVIINSTIKPGTSKNISKRSNKLVVHSPIMGVHPNLKNDILTFTKIIGPTSKESATMAQKHFKKIGIKTKTISNAAASELGKLLDTSYYSWNIVFNKLVYKMCKDNKIEFNDTYRVFNEIYNAGYKKTKPNVIRPILKYKPGRIGGHCVVPNLELLESFNKNLISEFSLKVNDKFA